jgi:hypothetical protein
LTSASVNASLSVSFDQVQSISGDTALTMNVDAGDTITATGFYEATPVSATSTTYTYFDDALHSNQLATLTVNVS